MARQKDWNANNPEAPAKALDTLSSIHADFNDMATGDKKVSIADLVVLGGVAAIGKAADQAA